MKSNNVLFGIKSAVFGFALFGTTCSVSIAHELRATFVPTCPTSDAPVPINGREFALGAIFTGIAASFAGSAVDAGIGILKKTVNPDAVTIDSVSFLQDGLYAHVQTDDANEIQVNPELGCLVIAVGTFAGGEGDWNLPFEADKGKKDSAVSVLKQTLALSAPPIYYIEAAIKLSPDESSLTWQPTRIYFGEFLHESFWAGKTRGIKVSVSLHKPGVASSAYMQEFKYDSVEAGFSKNADQLKRGKIGSWGTLPAPSSSTASNVTPAPLPGTPFDPFNLVVQIIESPKPYKLAIMAVDAVDANKQPIKDEFTQFIDPAKRRASEATSQSTTITAVNNFLTQWQKAVDACMADKTITAVEKLQCQTSIDQAALDKNKANAACKIEKITSCDRLGELTSLDVK